MDDMARISGVGAKKLERYGAAFLEVIAGEAEKLHPQRRKLAGRAAGSLYDQLLATQADLSRGECGTLKPLSCSASQLAKIADRRPTEEYGLAQVLDDKRMERFGDAFLDILRAG
jgi:ATP-dependent DNA helicase RecQ